MANVAIKRVYQAAKVYRGPYKDQAPDLIVGYAGGYRVSWEAAIGRTSREVFHDNKKAWSGDHCVDPSVVPGVLFCNRKIDSPQPRLLDIAPTVLDLFGIPAPDYMDGRRWPLGNRPTRVSSDSAIRQLHTPGGVMTEPSSPHVETPLIPERRGRRGRGRRARCGRLVLAGRRQSRLEESRQEGDCDRHRRHGSASECAA